MDELIKDSTLPTGDPDSSPTMNTEGSALGTKPKGRAPRNFKVRRQTKKNLPVQVPIVQENAAKGHLTHQEAKFIQAVASPESEHFLQPGAAHVAVYPSDSAAGSPSRVTRLVEKPPVAQTLKDLLDTPTLRSKIRAGLDTILDDIEHAKFRPREWTDALRAWAELTGNKQPDKILAVPVTAEDRQTRYEEVLARVRNEQAKLKAPEPAQEAILVPD